MKKLEGQDRQHLSAAEGWLGLGDYLEADAELEHITPALRAHPDVLQIRAKIYAAAGKWEMVVEIGRTLAGLLPNKPFGVLHHAHALRQLSRTGEAREVLLPAAEKFKKEWRIAYALASYCSMLGSKREAYDWLERAIEIADIDIRATALDDPELKTLWADIAET